jgi:HTH-type transcriptional regulator, sugar sensing transcriptional regulator
MITTKKAAENSLIEFGFTEYEARVYLTLAKNGPSSGYEVARLSGVPRPNVYSALEKLRERGAVGQTVKGSAALYSACPINDLLKNETGKMKSRVEKAKAAFGSFTQAKEQGLAWNLADYETVLAKAIGMVQDAKERVVIGIWSSEAGLLCESLKKVVKKGIDTTVLCLQGCETNCGGCVGSVYRYRIAPRPGTRWLMAAVDNSEVLVSQIHADGSASGFTSRLSVIVDMLQQYILNAVAISEIGRSLGPKLPDLMDAEAANALSRTGFALGKEKFEVNNEENTGGQS